METSRSKSVSEFCSVFLEERKSIVLTFSS